MLSDIQSDIQEDDRDGEYSMLTADSDDGLENQAAWLLH